MKSLITAAVLGLLALALFFATMGVLAVMKPKPAPSPATLLEIRTHFARGFQQGFLFAQEVALKPDRMPLADMEKQATQIANSYEP